jgi:hypothetical protein
VTKIDADTAKKVMDILSNPEMMSKISAIASGVSPSTPLPEQPIPASIPQPTVQGNSRADLLLALKPFLKEEKRGKIDNVIKALTIATTVSKLKGGGFNV